MENKTPITQDLLQKNGFTLIYSGAFLEETKGHKMNYHVSIYFRRKITVIINAYIKEASLEMPIKYMQELQQALNLLGINKKLEF